MTLEVFVFMVKWTALVSVSFSSSPEFSTKHLAVRNFFDVLVQVQKFVLNNIYQKRDK
jgi:hypothetical protein